MAAARCIAAAVHIGPPGLCGATGTLYMSASAAILRISEKPPACIRSGWTMRQPPFSRSSRYSKRDSRRSPVAIGVLISRCSATIAFAFSNGIGSSNQPGRNGCSASSIITAVRGDRNSLHSMKMSASGPAPSRAPSISAAALRISPAVLSRRPSNENGRHLNAVKPRRTASCAPANAFSGVSAPCSQWLA